STASMLDSVGCRHMISYSSRMPYARARYVPGRDCGPRNPPQRCDHLALGARLAMGRVAYCTIVRESRRIDATRLAVPRGSDSPDSRRDDETAAAAPRHRRRVALHRGRLRGGSHGCDIATAAIAGVAHE